MCVCTSEDEHATEPLSCTSHDSECLAVRKASPDIWQVSLQDCLSPLLAQFMFQVRQDQAGIVMVPRI